MMITIKWPIKVEMIKVKDKAEQEQIVEYC